MTTVEIAYLAFNNNLSIEICSLIPPSQNWLKKYQKLYFNIRVLSVGVIDHGRRLGQTIQCDISW